MATSFDVIVTENMFGDILTDEVVCYNRLNGITTFCLNRYLHFCI